jgi:hypothetical protein
MSLDFPASPSNGDTYENYVYDATAGVWKRLAPGGQLGDLNDVVITTSTANELLQYDGSDWVNVSQAAAGAIPVFDDSTARGSAIPTPTEGMVTYLKDTDQLFKYTTSWVPAGGLVAVKTVTKTNTFSSSLAAGAFIDVTDLSITHTVSNSANKIILSAMLGTISGPTSVTTGTAFAVGGSREPVGNSDGNRLRVTTGILSATQNDVGVIGHPVMLQAVLTPGAGSKTYTVQIANMDTSTNTHFVNRSSADADNVRVPRSASTFTLMEVAV